MPNSITFPFETEKGNTLYEPIEASIVRPVAKGIPLIIRSTVLPFHPSPQASNISSKYKHVPEVEEIVYTPLESKGIPFHI